VGSGSVVTFEKRDGAIVRLGLDESLAAASGRLPPGVYTTFRTYGGDRILRFPAHLRRLESSAKLQGTPAPLDAAAMRRLVGAALTTTGHPESRVRLTVAPPRVFASVEPFVPLPRSRYGEGVSCVTLPLQRERPRVKDTRFIPTAQKAYRELPPGIEEGLLLTPDGTILEGLTSNFFAVLDGALHTEEERVLAGITRSLVVEVAEAALPVAPRAVGRDELPRVSESFLSSASREVLPVVRIDGREIGDGRVGPQTLEIMRGFAEAVRRETERVTGGAGSGRRRP